MNVSTNYDYYKQSYLLGSLSSTNASTYNNSTTSATNSTSTDSVSAISAKSVSSTEGWEGLLNNLSASRMRKALEEKTKEMPEEFALKDNIKADIDAIKNLDIANLSDDEVKEILTNLQSDLQQMPPGGRGQNVLDADLDTLSTDEMRSLLTEVQTDVNSMDKNRPPREDMGLMEMDFSSLLTSDTETEDTLSALIAALTEKYELSTSSDDYLSKLKESVTTTITEQKAKLDSLATSLLEKLDEWNSHLNEESTTDYTEGVI